MSLSIANYSLLQCIFIIIHLGLNISWKKFTIPNLRSQIYSKNSFHKIYHSTKHNKAHILLTFSLQSHTTTTTALLCPPHWGWTYYFCLFRRPPSVTLGFRSFQGQVFILSLPNLVWVFIGLIACMVLLLVKIAL